MFSSGWEGGRERERDMEDTANKDNIEESQGSLYGQQQVCVHHLITYVLVIIHRHWGELSS